MNCCSSKDTKAIHRLENIIHILYPKPPIFRYIQMPQSFHICVWKTKNSRSWLIRIGDVVCLWYEVRREKIESGSISTMQCEYRHWNFSHKNLYLSTVQHRKIYFMKTYHTPLPYIWKFRSWDVGLRGWIRKIWMEKVYVTRHLIFLKCGFRCYIIHIYERTHDDFEIYVWQHTQIDIICMLPKVYRFHQTSNTESLALEILIFIWHFRCYTKLLSDCLSNAKVFLFYEIKRKRFRHERRNNFE